MTRKDLQDALVKETKELLKDVWAKNSLGEDVQAQVFPQRLPVMTEDEDDETKLFPYAIVRLGDAKTAGDEDHGTSQLTGSWECMTTNEKARDIFIS